MFWLLFSYSPARRYCLLHKNCPRQQLRALVCVEIGISEQYGIDIITNVQSYTEIEFYHENN